MISADLFFCGWLDRAAFEAVHELYKSGVDVSDWRWREPIEQMHNASKGLAPVNLVDFQRLQPHEFAL
jgi:hypothetical protein